jgi:SAM-dependent methyltransferase
MKLTDQAAVLAEYSSEHRHDARRAVFTQWLDGTNARDVALEAIVQRQPERVLEIGCGDGEFAALTQQRLGRPVTAIDSSQRMVELTHARGVAASVADAAAVPFPDGSFDCVVANWMLYHVVSLDATLCEITRLLRHDGALVAATVGERNLEELWQLVGAPPDLSDYTFTRESGEATLARHFRTVERADVDAHVVFPDADAVASYVAVSLGRAHLAGRVPRDLGSFRVRTAQSVFVATR